MVGVCGDEHGLVRGLAGGGSFVWNEDVFRVLLVEIRIIHDTLPWHPLESLLPSGLSPSISENAFFSVN